MRPVAANNYRVSAPEALADPAEGSDLLRTSGRRKIGHRTLPVERSKQGSIALPRCRRGKNPGDGPLPLNGADLRGKLTFTMAGRWLFEKLTVILGQSATKPDLQRLVYLGALVHIVNTRTHRCNGITAVERIQAATC